MRYRRTNQRRRAVAAVEFALILPVIMILVSGLLEVGRMAEVQQIVTEAAREGGRQASTTLLTTAQVQQVVTEYLQAALNDGDGTGKTGQTRTQNATITVTNLTSSDASGTPPRTDPTGAVQLDQFQVVVTIPFRDLRWASPSLVTNNSTLVTGTALWNSMADLAYPTPSAPPPQ